MSDPQASTTRMLGRYELIYLMAQGGMGEVHLAKLTGVAGFEKYCIVKTILPQKNSDPQFVDRFHHEARVLVHLNHSNIAQVYDMGQVDETLFMAIEYVAGVDLSRIQTRANELGAQVPLSVALLVGQKIAEGLGYAHRKVGADGTPLTIVHRDVSPQNVMVSYEGEVKVIDFGLAKSTVRSKNTQPSTVMGKLGYMSPEQARAEKLDHRTDIYSCGVVIWELIAGKPLFDGQTMGEMFAAMANPKIPSLSSLRGDVTPALDRVIARALAVNANERYARADDFARALAEVLMQEGSIGAEELGNYVRGLCPEEFADQRRLLSRLSKVNRPPSGPPMPLSETGLEGTAIRAPVSAAAHAVAPLRPPAPAPLAAIPLVSALPPVSGPVAPTGSFAAPAPRDRKPLLLLVLLLLLLGGVGALVGARLLSKTDPPKSDESHAQVPAIQTPALPERPSTVARTRIAASNPREIFLDRNEHYLRAGSTDGLNVGDTVKVVGPGSDQADRELIGEATVLEVWGNLSRLRLDDASQKEKGRIFGSIEAKGQRRAPVASSKHAPPHREARPVVATATEPQSPPPSEPPQPQAPPVATPTPAPPPPPATAERGLHGSASLAGFGPLRRLVLLNQDPTPWTHCELRLPTNQHYKMDFLAAADTESIMLRRFVQDGEERDVENTFVTVRCQQGSVKLWLPR